jgi:hypothetical protein
LDGSGDVNGVRELDPHPVAQLRRGPKNWPINGDHPNEAVWCKQFLICCDQVICPQFEWLRQDFSYRQFRSEGMNSAFIYRVKQLPK